MVAKFKNWKYIIIQNFIYLNNTSAAIYRTLFKTFIKLKNALFFIKLELITVIYTKICIYGNNCHFTNLINILLLKATKKYNKH